MTWLITSTASSRLALVPDKGLVVSDLQIIRNCRQQRHPNNNDSRQAGEVVGGRPITLPSDVQNRSEFTEASLDNINTFFLHLILLF